MCEYLEMGWCLLATLSYIGFILLDDILIYHFVNATIHKAAVIETNIELCEIDLQF